MATYRKGTQIGSGGFGCVYHATRTDDDWKCVMKYLKDDHSPEDLRRFKREVRMQSQLKHRHVVSIVGQNLKADPPWFAMPRAEMNLERFMTTRPEAQSESLDVFIGIAKGVRHAHLNGIVHRDLKPDNVLLFPDDDEPDKLIPRVADFGLGKEMARATTVLTQTNMMLGSIAYMAPEQWGKAQNADERADIFSLGKVFYLMLTGASPHPTLHLDAVPGQYRYFIQKATHPEPDRRYQSIDDMLSALDFATRPLEKPAEALQEMINELDMTTTLGEEETQPLAQHFCDNANEYEVNQLLHQLPEPLVHALLEYHQDAFKQAFFAYDREIDEGVTFEYCDKVANFYERVFRGTGDYDIRHLVLQRLARLGADYNRWHVGQVFGRVVNALDDVSLVHALHDILEANSRVLEFNRTYLDKRRVAREIRPLLQD